MSDLDIDTTSEQVGADEVSAESLSEIMEDAVSMLLIHARVDVETRVSQVGDLLGQQFHSLNFHRSNFLIDASAYLGRVAEDNWLVDLQLWEKRIQAVDLNWTDLDLFSSC